MYSACADLAVGSALRDQRQHLELARRQPQGFPSGSAPPICTAPSLVGGLDASLEPAAFDQCPSSSPSSHPRAERLGDRQCHTSRLRRPRRVRLTRPAPSASRQRAKRRTIGTVERVPGLGSDPPESGFRGAAGTRCLGTLPAGQPGGSSTGPPSCAGGVEAVEVDSDPRERVALYFGVLQVPRASRSVCFHGQARRR